jgi:site-specific DNA-methyltransferase (adenine-specific)
MNGLEKFINQVICGDALEVLRKMPDESIHLGITSPPYDKKEKHGG